MIIFPQIQITKNVANIVNKNKKTMILAKKHKIGLNFFIDITRTGYNVTGTDH